ncbi:MAG: hypothetical protein HYW45_01790 [Candidatus Daviesbacteria bacterium]|nr:MAG: hypothetical protein HYW45_01790 [Candidatus Daviesbacteria bacterium]
MKEHVFEDGPSEQEWPSERIIKALEQGFNSLRVTLARMREYFSIPRPSDEFLDQQPTLPNSGQPNPDTPLDKKPNLS